MSDTVNARTTPWHLWVVGAVALLWNGYGGYDYLMSHLQGAAFYEQVGMSDAQIAYMAAYPAWMHAVWALGVWGAVAGSVLLLLRSRFAVHAFILSLLGIIGSNGARVPAARMATIHFIKQSPWAGYLTRWSRAVHAPDPWIPDRQEGAVPISPR